MTYFSQLLGEMVRSSASDLYLTVNSPPTLRVEDDLEPIGVDILSAQDTEAIAMAILNAQQREEFLRTQEMNLGVEDRNFGRFRINIFRQRSCVGLVVRRIQHVIPTVEGLGLPPVYNQIVSAKRGLVLVVGAAGSGKSTSLAAMIGYRNRTMPGHIVTIEDPIEFVHIHERSIVTQREIGIDTPSLQSGLKNALRQAPDLLLIGEIRDAETMDAAICFAETGHLCLATLHSNNAVQALERVLGFFPVERHHQILVQLSMNLRAIVSQRLVQTVQGRHDLGARVAAVEVLLDTPRIKDLIAKGQISEIRDVVERCSEVAMQTFDQHLYELFSRGIISFEEALRHADSANNLRVRARLAGVEPEISKGNPSAGNELEFLDSQLETKGRG